jgi:hypothetical protein
MFQGLDAQRLVALFVAGWALLSFPLLALWDHEARVFGLPLFPLALLGIWALLIAARAGIVARGRERDPAASDTARPH